MEKSPSEATVEVIVAFEHDQAFAQELAEWSADITARYPDNEVRLDAGIDKVRVHPHATVQQLGVTADKLFELFGAVGDLVSTSNHWRLWADFAMNPDGQ